jgi:NADH:ubiquinone oxidoreductase subunit 6 (subunit J)
MLGGVLLIALVAVAWLAPWQQADPPMALPTAAAIGNGLLDQGLLPLEVTGLLLVAVIIGSVVIARRDRPGEPES